MIDVIDKSSEMPPIRISRIPNLYTDSSLSMGPLLK